MTFSPHVLPNSKKNDITQTKDILNVLAGRYLSFLNLKGVFGLFNFPTPPTYCFQINLPETNKQANKTICILYGTCSLREKATTILQSELYRACVTFLSSLSGY